MTPYKILCTSRKSADLVMLLNQLRLYLPFAPIMMGSNPMHLRGSIM